MRFFLSLLVGLLTLTSLYADSCCRNKKCVTEYINGYVGTGYREDGFNFNTANDADGTISVAREMKWKELQILPVYGYIDYRHNCSFVAKLYGDYGRIYDGTAHNNEFIGNGVLALREKGCAGRGEIWDIGGGIGYNFELCEDMWTFTPLIGYDHNEQHYRLYDVQREFGPFQGLLGNQHHSYRSLWRGPWVGAEMKCGPWLCTDLWLRMGYDWHYMLFRGRLKDTEPLPGTPITLKCERRQKAHGQGHHFWAGIDYHCVRAWSIGVYASYKDYRANTGTEISKCNDSTLNSKVKFNKGHWYSFNLLLTIGYHWP